MNEIECAITNFEEFLEADIGQGDLHMCSADIALAAIREQAERNKGCRYCQDKSYKQKGYYVDDPEGEIVGINHYCMNCGKRLEVEP